jgi:glucose/arabinose dehydrogenase
MHPRTVSAAAAAALALALTGPGARAQGQLRAQVYASGFAAPVGFVQDPSDGTVQFVVEQGGRIRTVRGGAVLPADFLDLTPVVLSGGERGLLGMAFGPGGRVFVNFTNSAGHTVVARFRRSSDPLVADPASRFDLQLGASGERFIAQPFSNHNGGHLAFGPDGFLYIGLGDGGSGNDPGHRAQTRGSLLGKMLRVDVNVPDAHTAGYVVPADNPFANGAGGTRPEIWSFGLRNPWRYSFDAGTGALIVGDVGQSTWEEIDYEPRGRGGRNYGWRNREGAHDNVTSLPPAFLPLRDPIHELDRTLARSITGGHVYRGTGLGTAFQGRYFFGDFITSRVWSLGLAIDAASGEATAAGRTEHTADLGGAAELGGVASFGVDAANELYIVSYGRGAVLKLAGTGTPPSAPTGLRIIR